MEFIECNFTKRSWLLRNSHRPNFIIYYSYLPNFVISLNEACCYATRIGPIIQQNTISLFNITKYKTHKTNNFMGVIQILLNKNAPMQFNVVIKEHKIFNGSWNKIQQLTDIRSPLAMTLYISKTSTGCTAFVVSQLTVILLNSSTLQNS